jgi:hypothetical protein
MKEGWEIKKLGEIADVEYGFTDKSTEDGDFRYVRITDIDSNGELISTDKKYLKYSKEADVSTCVSNARFEYSERMESISQALSGMTLQGQQQSRYEAPRRSGLLRTLRAQWLQNGRRMCQYSDGTVMNIGVGVCPTSI